MARNLHQPLTPLGREWAQWINEYPVGAERLEGSIEILKSGALDEITIDGGSVEATIWTKSGATIQPFAHFTPIDPSQWDLIWSLAPPDATKDFKKGILSPALRSAFAVAEVQAIPERYKEIKTGCTCSDWMRPCQHALALLRAIGAEIDADPMLLLRLRGGEQQPQPQPVPVEDSGEPLSTNPATFWGTPHDWSGFEKDLLESSAPTRLLKRLGPVSVYGVRMDPDSMFKPVYEGVASEAKLMLESIRRKTHT